MKFVVSICMCHLKCKSGILRKLIEFLRNYANLLAWLMCGKTWYLYCLSIAWILYYLIFNVCRLWKMPCLSAIKPVKTPPDIHRPKPLTPSPNAQFTNLEIDLGWAVWFRTHSKEKVVLVRNMLKHLAFHHKDVSQPRSPQTGLLQILFWLLHL